MRIVLRQALASALRARDAAAVSALRSALAAIENAEAVAAPAPGVAVSTGVGTTEVPRRDLTDAEVEDLVRAECTERLAVAAEYDRLGRADHATRLRAEAEVLARHLRV